MIHPFDDRHSDLLILLRIAPQDKELRRRNSQLELVNVGRRRLQLADDPKSLSRLVDVPEIGFWRCLEAPLFGKRPPNPYLSTLLG
jgi:hypothetical protein